MTNLFKQNKMFRVFLMYQFFSSIGSAMFSMFILLSVHLIFQNPIYTGIAGFLMAAPRIASFAVGPIVDRRNKITIMQVTTLLEFLVLSLLAFTPLLELIGILFIFAVIFVYNIAALFEIPAGTALLPQIVKEDEIMQANSLINIVAMAGGIIIGAVLFTSLAGDINFSFLYGISAVFVALAFGISLFLRITNSKDATTTEKSQKKPNYIQDLKQGAGFIKRSVLLFFVIAVVAMGFTAESAYVNRPMFLETHVGAQGYIVFVLMTLVGGIIASSVVGKLGDKYKVGRFVCVLLVLAGIVRVAFALLVPISLIGGLITVVVFTALAFSVDIIYVSLRQKIPPKDMVGRVDTISTTFTAISVALGAFVGGFLGNAIADVGHIFIYQGVSYVIIGVAIILVPSVRKLPKMDGIERVED